MPPNARVERTNGTVEEATVRRHHDESHGQLRAHLAGVVNACTFAKRRKTLRGRTVIELTSKQWIAGPDRVHRHPDHPGMGLNIRRRDALRVPT